MIEKDTENVRIVGKSLFRMQVCSPSEYSLRKQTFKWNCWFMYLPSAGYSAPSLLGLATPILPFTSPLPRGLPLLQPVLSPCSLHHTLSHFLPHSGCSFIFLRCPPLFSLLFFDRSRIFPSLQKVPLFPAAISPSYSTSKTITEVLSITMKYNCLF